MSQDSAQHEARAEPRARRQPIPIVRAAGPHEFDYAPRVWLRRTKADDNIT